MEPQKAIPTECVDWGGCYQPPIGGEQPYYVVRGLCIRIPALCISCLAFWQRIPAATLVLSLLRIAWLSRILGISIGCLAV